MRKKSDLILRRIPDRHERFAPGMIDRFKFAPPPSSIPANKTSLTNGVLPVEKPGIKKSDSVMEGITAAVVSPAKSSAALVNGFVNSPSRPATPTPKISIQAGGLDIPFEDRPALERTPEGMALFLLLDSQMKQLLDGQDTIDTNDSTSISLPSGRPRSSSNTLMMNGTSVIPLDVNERLKQLGDEDDELAVWKMVVEDTPEEKKEDAIAKALTEPNRQSKSPELVDADSKKRKR